MRKDWFECKDCGYAFDLDEKSFFGYICNDCAKVRYRKKQKIYNKTENGKKYIKKYQKTEKNEAELLKRLDYHDNSESLNRMNTETGKILEWGVDPND